MNPIDPFYYGLGSPVTGGFPGSAALGSQSGGIGPSSPRVAPMHHADSEG